MTTLTTDSDSSSDAQKGSHDDYRHLRQASPRFYHAPELDDALTVVYKVVGSVQSLTAVDIRGGAVVSVGKGMR